MEYRIEKDSLGDVKVPANAYWGSQAERSRQLFQISGLTEHPRMIDAYILLKKACTEANTELGLLDKEVGAAIIQAAREVLVQGPYKYPGIHADGGDEAPALRNQFP